MTGLELPAFGGHREVGMLDHADIGAHPPVQVALDADHHFGCGERLGLRLTGLDLGFPIHETRQQLLLRLRKLGLTGDLHPLLKDDELVQNRAVVLEFGRDLLTCGHRPFGR